MKIHLRNPEGFSPETVEYYKSFAELVPEEQADMIVVNDFQEANYLKKIVARNSTAEDGIKAKKIISLRGEDLSDFKDVSDLALAMSIMLTRLFKQESIRGKTMGIIGGEGRLGKNLTEVAENMDINIITYDNRK
mgnify:CR=1 FL=1